MIDSRLCYFVLFILLCMNANGQDSYDFIVGKEKSDNFQTIQEAINAVPDFRKAATTIFVKNGVYKEKLILPASKINVTLIGEDKMKTKVTHDDYASKKNRFGEEMGTTGSTTFFVFGEGFTALNITFENSAGPLGQAVAVRVDADKVTFTNCRFLGNQDTLYLYGENSRQYYKDCYIEGTVDFIFGWSTAFFENCTLFCKKGGRYITAASTMKNTRFGFVFINCTITGDADTGTFYLGRPWRPFAKTVFVNCSLDKQIKPEGWHNWNKPEAEVTSYYAEYGSKGPGGDIRNRVKWSHLLSKDEADEYAVEKVLGNWNETVTR